jgi:hypothetical protein
MKGREMLTVARFPVKNPARACRGGTPAMLRWPPVQTESWTVISETRGSRGCASRCRLRPGTFPRGGWSSAALWWLRATVGDVDWLRNQTNGWCQEVRVIKWRRRVPDRGCGLPRGGRNRGRTAAVLAVLRRRITTAWRHNRGRGKGKWQRGSRASYRRRDWWPLLGIIAGSKSPAFPVTERKRREIRGEEGADGWGPPVGEGKRERGYRFGFCGEWAVGSIWCWAEWFPRGPFLFLFPLLLFPFLFSLFLSYTFWIWSKQGQTNL